MKNLIVLIFLMLLVGCDKKEKEPAPVPPSQHLVTGFNFCDMYGNPTYKTGNPNVQITFQANGQTFRLITYPNPVNTEVGIRIYSPDSTTNDAMKIWIVAAPQSQELASNNF